MLTRLSTNTLSGYKQMIESLTVTADASALQINGNNGEQSTLSAVALRRAARDAASIKARIEHTEVHIPDDLAITHVRRVGSTGINIHFSDGHDRAIYPYAYLTGLVNNFDN